MSFDDSNKDERMYSKDAMIHAIEDFKDKIKFNTAYGTLDRNHSSEESQNGVMSLKRASHVIRELRYTMLTDKLEIVKKAANYWLYSEYKSSDKFEVDVEILLDTPYGRVVNNLLESGVQLGISSRCVTRRSLSDNSITSIELLSFDLISSETISTSRERNED